MSKARRVGDAERTATMLDLLHREYGDAGAMSLSRIVLAQRDTAEALHKACK